MSHQVHIRYGFASPCMSSIQRSFGLLQRIWIAKQAKISCTCNMYPWGKTSWEMRNMTASNSCTFDHPRSFFSVNKKTLRVAKFSCIHSNCNVSLFWPVTATIEQDPVRKPRPIYAHSFDEFAAPVGASAIGIVAVATWAAPKFCSFLVVELCLSVCKRWDTKKNTNKQ